MIQFVAQSCQNVHLAIREILYNNHREILNSTYIGKNSAYNQADFHAHQKGDFLQIQGEPEQVMRHNLPKRSQPLAFTSFAPLWFGANDIKGFWWNKCTPYFSICTPTFQNPRQHTDHHFIWIMAITPMWGLFNTQVVPQWKYLSALKCKKPEFMEAGITGSFQVLQPGSLGVMDNLKTLNLLPPRKCPKYWCSIICQMAHKLACFPWAWSS